MMKKEKKAIGKSIGSPRPYIIVTKVMLRMLENLK